jgi:hypothetical protein
MTKFLLILAVLFLAFQVGKGVLRRFLGLGPAQRPATRTRVTFRAGVKRSSRPADADDAKSEIDYSRVKDARFRDENRSDE